MYSHHAHALWVLSHVQNDFGFAISRLAFLTARKTNSAGGGANLVSCGGNGWVRFWNSSSNALIGEFVAHTQGARPHVTRRRFSFVTLLFLVKALMLFSIFFFCIF